MGAFARFLALAMAAFSLAASPAAVADPGLAAIQADPQTAALLAADGLQPVTRVMPQFPVKAVREGIERGSVRARMTVDADGAVTDVAIVDATPRRVFDRPVREALSQWRFNKGSPARTVDATLEFAR